MDAENGPLNPRGIIPILREEDIDMMQDNKKYENNEKFRNIFVKYFAGLDITEKDLEYIDDIEYTLVTERLFYDILFLIFCLDYYTNKLLN